MGLGHLYIVLYCYRYKEDGEVKYLEPAKKIFKEAELYTLEISFEDIERYNQTLAVAIIEEFYRLYNLSELTKA